VIREVVRGGKFVDGMKLRYRAEKKHLQDLTKAVGRLSVSHP